MMQLTIGTAQFGLDYGITNKSGAVHIDEINKIIHYARRCNILTIDTASAYGDSEYKLGSSNTGIADFRVITKTPPKSSAEAIEAKFFQSLDKLKIKKIYGLLVHHADDILSPEGEKIWNLLEKLKNKELVDKIGVSVYSAVEIQRILGKYAIDIVQLPINVLDQRLVKSGILQELKNKDVEIHARSLFLQGILLEKPEDIPEYFAAFKAPLLEWQKFLKTHNLTPLEGAIGFANSLHMIDCAVIGITSLSNLIEINSAFDKVLSFPALKYEALSSNNMHLINPHMWPTKS